MRIPQGRAGWWPDWWPRASSINPSAADWRSPSPSSVTTCAGRQSPMGDSNLVMVFVDAIEPCPIQPRVNVSVDLVAKLAASMKAGRHEPVLDVEPVSGRHGRYQLVCGEQRWRAGLTAGLGQGLGRGPRRPGCLGRLGKQGGEKRLP